MMSRPGLAKKREHVLQIHLAMRPSLLQAGLACLIKQSGPNVEVTENAEPGPGIVERVIEERPDLLILEPTLPELNGLDVVRLVRTSLERSAPASAMVVRDARPQVIAEAVEAGVKAILTEDATPHDVKKMLEVVPQGRSYLTETAVEAMTAAYGSENGRDSASVFAVLTPTERRVMQLLAEGLTTKEIGRDLSISPKTADTHRRNLMRKLDLNGLASLTRRAIREGLIALD